MLALPLLLGTAASRPSIWQGVLAVASAAGYLASSAGADWLRARRYQYLVPLAVWGAAFVFCGLVLVVAHPGLAAALIVILPAACVVAWTTTSGRRGSLVTSLAQVAQALVLVPAAATVSGSVDAAMVGRATLAAGVYLVGTVLVVRSMIRQRGNRGFLTLSIGYHVAAVGLEAVVLPVAYAVLALALALRAAVLPALQDRLAGGPRRIRPIHLGLVEMVASSALVVLAFLARF
jgi:hypothetical protein